jgi:hypothetical protein
VAQLVSLRRWSHTCITYRQGGKKRRDSHEPWNENELLTVSGHKDAYTEVLRTTLVDDKNINISDPG